MRPQWLSSSVSLILVGLMISYRYRAIDRAGRVRSETAQVESLEALHQEVTDNGWLLLSCHRSYRLRYLHRPISLNDDEMAQFFYQLNQLLSAQLPILQCFEQMALQQKKSHLRRLMVALTEHICAGKSLSQACAEFNSVFKPQWIAMIELGERTGQLSQVLSELEQMLLWQRQLQQKLFKILIYPALLSVVIVAVALLLMLWVVPQLESFLLSINTELGWSTQALLSLSQQLRSDGWGVLIVIFALLIVSSLSYLLNAKVRLLVSKACLQLPIIGSILQSYHATYLSKYLALMMKNGMKVSEALSVLSQVMPSLALQQRIRLVVKHLHTGTDLVELFDRHQLLPDVGVRLLQIGVHSGQLVQNLSSIERYYWNQLQRALNQIEPLIQPVMTLILGGLVIWMVSAVMQPMYGFMSVVM